MPAMNRCAMHVRETGNRVHNTGIFSRQAPKFVVKYYVKPPSSGGFFHCDQKLFLRATKELPKLLKEWLGLKITQHSELFQLLNNSFAVSTFQKRHFEQFWLCCSQGSKS